MHEAELALVIKGPAKKISQANWRSAVFGYTGLIDVSARGEGRRTWKAGSWLGKSFDTFAPIGPCITTADEIPEPNDVVVRFWNDGRVAPQLQHRRHGAPGEPELVEFASTVMTLNTGDLIACGTNHEGLGALQDGETVEIEIQHVGRMSLKVVDPLKRQWERGIYMGANSTNPEAVKRHRPQGANLKGPAMTDIDIRKIVTLREVIFSELGALAARPIVRAVGMAVIRNPFAGRRVADLRELFEAGAALGERIMPELVKLLDGPAISYGKGALVGVDGEMEHGGALAVIRCSGGQCAPQSAAARR